MPCLWAKQVSCTRLLKESKIRRQLHAGLVFMSFSHLCMLHYSDVILPFIFCCYSKSNIRAMALVVLFAARVLNAIKSMTEFASILSEMARRITKGTPFL